MTFKLSLAGLKFLLDNHLSPREIEIVSRMYDCKTNQEIADNLFVTEKTVKFHLTNIYKKMKVKNRVTLIVMMSDYFYQEREVKKLKRAAKKKSRTSRAR